MLRIRFSFLLVGLLTASSAFGQVPTGSIIWLRADKGVVVAGGRVQRWQDQSGKGNDASMTDMTYQPYFATAAVDGLPAIVFKGASYMQCPNVFPTNKDYTICTVVRFDDGNPKKNIICREKTTFFLILLKHTPFF